MDLFWYTAFSTQKQFFLFFYKLQGEIELHAVAELHKLKFLEFLRV